MDCARLVAAFQRRLADDPFRGRLTGSASSSRRSGLRGTTIKQVDCPASPLTESPTVPTKPHAPPSDFFDAAAPIFDAAPDFLDLAASFSNSAAGFFHPRTPFIRSRTAFLQPRIAFASIRTPFCG